MARPWIKLYTSLLGELNFNKLDQEGQMFWIRCLLAAGANDDCGKIGDLDDVAFMTRCNGRNVEALAEKMVALKMLTLDEGDYSVTKWDAYQQNRSDAARKRDSRESQKARCHVTGHEAVTGQVRDESHIPSVTCHNKKRGEEKRVKTETETNTYRNSGELLVSPSGDTPRDKIDFAGILESWNETMLGTMLPKLNTMSEGRKKHVRARAREASAFKAQPDCVTGGASVYSVDWSMCQTWRLFFEYVRYECDEWWMKWGRMTFDWLVKPDNFIKAVEGNYENESGAKVPFGQLSAEDSEFFRNLDKKKETQ